MKSAGTPKTFRQPKKRKTNGAALDFSQPSQRRTDSKVAVSYEPHTARKGETAFKDSRGINYGVAGDGSLRALNKPRSRVKRIRDERREASRAQQQKRKDQNVEPKGTDNKTDR